MADNDKIKKLWKLMAKDLEKKDPNKDCPYKGIVMSEPWYLEIIPICGRDEEQYEPNLDFFREKAVRPEDFDESSLPPELLEIVKEEQNSDVSWYPNYVSAAVSGDTLEKAIEKMHLKLRLLEHGYILTDTASYKEWYLNADNGAWLLND